MSILPTDDDLARFALPPGFHCASTACGLKASGRPDLAMVWSDTPCSAAGLFTTNRVQAAPVVVDRVRLAAAPGSIRGVLANAGCANAVTGDRGLADARRMAALGEAAIGAGDGQVLVLSTGVIGVFLDMEKLERGVRALASPAAARSAGDAARAITTTDTRPKIAAATAALPGGAVRIAGFAKGAGMIHPRMATMLAVLTTDARIAPARLDAALRRAVAVSFDRISVDGDMSTNDTVLALASGAAGVEVADAGGAFDEALAAVCVSLARQIARDGEGATRLVELVVEGARDGREAHLVGDAIACSPLVKTAIHGADPNWGRILAAAGYSGADIEPARVRLWFGAGGGAVQLLDRGLPLPFDAARASALLREDPARIRLDLGLGGASATLWTCDLSAEYVRVNADYTT